MFPTVPVWFKKNLLLLFLSIICGLPKVFAQPANDNCTNATTINIGSNGFALGAFNSSQMDISAATLQTGETFAPGILTAGLSKKSIWFKFSIPTTRSVEVFLKQPSVAIADGGVGFAVYKTSSCLPGDAQISTKLTPIAKFASSKHPCLEAGDYYVQVSANNNASGLVFISLDIGEPDPAPYDKPVTACKFGKVGTNITTGVEFNVSCQSIDNAAEICLSNSSFKDYTKSTWHTFTTADYFDFVALMISGNANNSGDQSKIKIGFRLFEGDISTTPLAALTQIGGCDSLYYNSIVADFRLFKCGALKPNTAYTVQLIYHTDFINTFRFAVHSAGNAPTRAPEPILGIPAASKMGVLPTSFAGVTTYANKDRFACNARHINYNCPKTLPKAGLLVKDNNVPFTLSTFYSFSLANTAQLDLYASGGGWAMYVRLYKQPLGANCMDLDTANIVAAGTNNIIVECMPPGDYVVQIMGSDSAYCHAYGFCPGSSSLLTGDAFLPLYRNLGGEVNLRITAHTQVGVNKFSLNTPGAFEKINANGSGVMQPLQLYKTYTTTPDTLGCSNTVVPLEGCGYDKASYREFVVADSSIFRVETGNYGYTHLFKGDANALAVSQNAFSWPQKITGLTPQRICMWNTDAPSTSTCITPGTFSLVSMSPLYPGGTLTIHQPAFSAIAPKPKHITPQTAQDMGDLWMQLGPGGGTIASDIDTFSCYDNPAIIDGLEGCVWGPYKATKLIYRQFYLSQPSNLRITEGGGSLPTYNGYLTLFSGKATDGIAGLKAVGDPWKCFYDQRNQGSCAQLPAGWYTVVAYGHGGSYQYPLQTTSAQGDNYSRLGLPNAFYVFLYPKTCASPQFNRPSKASVDTITKKPYLVDWAPRIGHTAAYPATWQKYMLNKENFDCTLDTAFIRQNMTDCPGDNQKVAFYVFQITKESYVKIGGIPHDNTIWRRVYAFDVRTADSLKLKTQPPLQACMNKEDAIEFCKLQPGYYTLVVFPPSTFNCNSIQPTIYVDQVGFSRFDHANNAYDFGVIKSDSTWYNGKIGDVNPLNGGRAPSNDFFYCTTGAQEKDPNMAACQFLYNPYIYPSTNNTVLHPDYNKVPDYFGSYIDRRNLWYTFTVNQPGLVRVKVGLPTPGKNVIGGFAVFKSDVDGSLPFTTVVSQGLVDSTLVQGLSFVAKNFSSNPCPTNLTQELAFFVEPCNFKPVRYYIILDNSNTYAYSKDLMLPNSQVEVSVLLGNISVPPTKFDHYSEANDLGVVNSGKKKGAVDNFTCATKDLPDPLYAYTACQKTLWYKFTTTVTGTIRYAAFFRNTYNYYYDHIQLFRQIKPNDSSSNGLLHLPYTTTYYDNATASNWAQQCISPGTYYILLPGCNATNDDVFPEIEIIPSAGDFCSVPMIANLNGAGNSVVPVTVDCHTIGTDYGEFNQTITCPANALTKDYKTSWYRLDIGGTDTLDITVFINEKTNAGSTDIKYRMMTGSCGAMQEQSCVQDALTRNTYECMVPGNSYFIQVFTPILFNGAPVNGDIDLNISSVKHIASCAPANNCIAVAEFFPKFDCTKDRNISITNLSTYGSDIKYEWDFGYNNQKSNAVAPEFFYPALTTDETYTIKLKVTNLVCGKTDEVSKTITIPARPSVNLGNDTVICTGPASVELDAASHTGTSYQWYSWIGYWNPSSTNSKISVTTLSSLIVELTYNNCKARDTINVWINPIAKRDMVTSVLCKVDQVTLNAYRGQGEQYKWNTGEAINAITVSQPGYYWCDMYLNGCIVRDSFYVINPSATQQNKTVTICQADLPYVADATIAGASSYLWNDNNTNAKRNISSPGNWWVDVTINGCAIRDSLTLKVDSFRNVTIPARICLGQSYSLPSWKTISTPGTHRDTLRNARGCDSLITILNLTVETATVVQTNAFFFTGQSYALPWGQSVNAAGTYSNTIKSSIGCDSVITIVRLSLLNVQTQIKDTSICPGASYTLPWGGRVGAAGAYADTLRSASGADSLIKILNLSIIPASILTKDTIVCQGNSFTFRANNAVSYKWSPANDLSATNVRNPLFTANQTRLYKLDATYNITGTSITCTDQVRIEVITKTIIDKKAIICAGETYTLPGGIQLNATGVYADTLRSVTGCDSLITNVDLIVQAPVTKTLSAFICQGQSYTLPSGKTVNLAGLYRDTIRYASGCDSLITVLNLTRYSATDRNVSATICLGNSFTLPSGRVVRNAGTYNDTLRYVSGCDSVRTTLSLSVTDALRNAATAYICAGTSYRLPSGRMVSVAGSYRDTVRTAGGCDSLISDINLVVDGATVQTLSPTICMGNAFVLPSGKRITAAGNYLDTLHNIRGCDSIRFTANLSITPVRFGTASATLCAGQTYTRPSGKIASAPGTYLDTIRSVVTGCDSVVTTTLTYRSALTVSLTAPTFVCAGTPATLTATATGGNGGPYTYVWTGATGSSNSVSVTPGTTTQYKVSVSDGCTIPSARDSVTIAYIPLPKPGLNNATITICRGSSISLSASGGTSYTWSPAATLSNPTIAKPQASPVTDTRYRVQVTTAQGCKGNDSVLVRVTQPFTLTASADTFVCAGGSVMLSAGGALRYQWAGAGLSSTTGSQVMARPGNTATYTISGYGPDSCFTQTESIRVTVIALPTVNAGRDTTVMVGSTLTLKPAYTGNNLSYLWSPSQSLSCVDCARPVARPEQSTEYTITVSNSFGCRATDAIKIELFCNAESVFLPNTFTPNGDGANDIWYPRGAGIKQVKYLKVFNRWGQAIYERSNFSTDDRSAGWDGTYKGQLLAADVFVYTMAVTCDNGQTVETKGNVMIVR